MIAIHHRKGSFSDRWIEYCKINSINYKLVDCCSTSIIDEIKDCNILLWHWNHVDPFAIKNARQIISSLEKAGIKVYPNTSTCWHYDDKIAQKYLLEAIKAPSVPSYVFYEKRKALEWIENTCYPKVFKLRCGAGSKNVMLVKNKQEARKLCNKAFGVGFKPIAGYFEDGKNKLRKATSMAGFVRKLKNAPKSMYNIIKLNALMEREKGYIYFQDFIPDNSFDIRVVVIGDRVWAFTRDVRPGDFRASGSGSICHQMQGRFSNKCLQLAIDTSKKINSQSLAFDFIKTGDDEYLIVEISYCFVVGGGLYQSQGFWDKNLNWHNKQMYPEDAIIDDIM